MNMKNLKKNIALLISVIMIFTTVLNASAAWDGYVGADGAQDTGSSVIVLDMNSIANILGSGASISDKVKNNSNYSAAWLDMVKQTQLSFKKNIVTNLIDYDTLVVSLNSKAATGHQIVMMIYCDTRIKNSNKTALYTYSFVLDFEGWKTFELNIESDLTARNAPNISKISRIEFSSTGYGSTANTPEDGVWFDSIIAKNSDAVGVGKSTYTQSDVDEFSKAAKNSIVLFNQNKYVWNRGNVEIINPENSREKITEYSDVTMAPVSFYKKFYDAEVKEEADKVEITINGKTLSCVPERKEYTFEGEAKEFLVAPQNYNEINFIPVVEALECFGYIGETIDNLTAVGDEEFILGLESKSIWREVGAGLLAGVFDVSLVTDDDFDMLSRRMKEYYTGDETISLDDPYIKKMVEGYDTSAQSSWKSMNKGDDITILFGKKFPTTTGDMRSQYEYLEKMALGYGTYGSSLYKDKQLKNDILYGLEWLYENLYGEDELNEEGWRSIWEFNWWDWCVGVPQSLVKTLAIMKDDMPQEDVDKYLRISKEIVDIRHSAKTASQAGGRIYVMTAAAILSHDRELLEDCFDDFNLVCAPFDGDRDGEGHFEEDGMYMAHGFAYTAGYGGSRVERVSRVLSLTLDSNSEFTSPYDYDMYSDAIAETYVKQMWNGRSMRMLMGRQWETNDEFIASLTILTSYADMLGMYGEETDNQIYDMISSNIDAEMLEYAAGRYPAMPYIKLCRVYNDIKSDNDKETANWDTGYVSYVTDKVIQKRNGYAFALSMSSERNYNYESINTTNTRGWYMADGMLYMYTDYDPDQYGATWGKEANKYRMPGTTVDTQERERVSVALASTWKSGQDFVGGTEYNDDYVTAAMFSESFHNEELLGDIVYDTGTNSTDNGGALPLHDCSLMSQKSWFMFDDEVVALGAGVNADDGFEVNTIVENRYLISSEENTTITNNVDNELKIVSVSATGNDGNVEANVIDNDLETRWSMQGSEGCLLTLELEKAVPIGYMGIAILNGQNSGFLFDLQVSEDGVKWTDVGSYTTELTKYMRPIDLKGVTAKYVRINGHGRTTGSLWNSITEVKLYSPLADGTMVTAFAGEGDGDDKYIRGTEKIYLDGALMSKLPYYKEVTNPKWVNVQGAGGYIFPNGGSFVMNKEKNGFLEMWFNHGVSPTDGEYAYILAPNQTKEQTEEYAQNPDVEILSNTKEIQAVYEKNLNLKGIVFWKEGTLNEVEAKQPCIVMLGEQDGEYTFTVSDPTQKLTTGTVVIDKALEMVDGSDAISCSVENGKTVITIDFAQSGKTYKAILK